MKNFKRFLSLALAVLMVAALAMTAFAEGETLAAETVYNYVNSNTFTEVDCGEANGTTFTIYNTAAAEDYDIYKFVTFTTTGDVTTYTAANGWENFFTNNEINDVYVNYDSTTKAVEFINNALNDDAFTEKVYTYASTTNGLTKFTGTGKAPTITESSSTEGNLTTITVTTTYYPIKYNKISKGLYISNINNGVIHNVTENAVARAHEMEAPEEPFETKGTITVTKGAPKEDYSIYQILYVDNYSIPAPGTGETAKFSYRVNSTWREFVESVTDSAGNKFFKIDENDIVTWNLADTSKPKAGELAAKAIQYAEANKINPIATKTSGEQTYDDSGKPVEITVTFDNLELGYYLLDTTLGTLCSLDTTATNVSIQDKNNVPSNEKEVKENVGGNYGKSNDQKIGEEVEFRSKITIPKGTNKLTFHDIMEKGLAFVDGSVEIIKGDFNTGTAITNSDTNTYYEVNTENLEDGCTFEVEFKDKFFNDSSIINSNADTTIIWVKYKAKLTKDAIIGDVGNKNTSKISYGDKNNYTPGSETITKTWEIPVWKYITGTQTPLAGAMFELYPDASPALEVDAGNPNAIGFIEVNNGVLRKGDKFDENGVIVLDPATKAPVQEEQRWIAYRVATPEGPCHLF